MLREFLAVNIFGFLLTFARVGTAMILLPGFSAAWVSVRTRAAIALAITFVSLPMVKAAWPPIPPSAIELILLFVGEIFIGVFIGSVGMILITALQAAGSFIALFSSMANALIRDPIAESQSALTAGFLTTTGIVMIFVTDSHHLMLKGVLSSYSLFQPGNGFFGGDVADVIARTVNDAVKIGLQLAAPFVVSALAYYAGLGLLNRLMPMLPIFFVGLPVQLIMQIAVLMITFSSIMMTFMMFFDDRFRTLFLP